MSRTDPSDEGPIDGDVATDGPVLSIADLSVTLGDNDVLAGVSLDVERGEFVGLVGPNGAGKTTLLRAARGSLTPDSGRVQIAGEAADALSAKAVGRRVATVPQDTSISFSFDVREIVEMGRTPHVPRFGSMDEADHAAVERAMERTEVAEFADRPVTEVSGGERSRVLLARALAQETPLLLLDEPTAGLDPLGVAEFHRILDRLREESDLTVVITSHVLSEIEALCDDAAVLHDGDLLFDGPVDELRELGGDDIEAGFGALIAEAGGSRGETLEVER
ncbi:ABC transporter ATP-binding protein [Halolamina salina]|uniref:ABC transporter ATP-binding protein n=1 Tax=Halolamina salina TaxID=1220023 RepID=UPI00360B3C9E